MGMISEKIPEGLDGDNSSGYRLGIRCDGLKQVFQALPAAATEFGQQLAIIHKIAAQDFGRLKTICR